MDRGLSLRLAATAALVVGGFITAVTGDRRIIVGITGGTLGLGLLAAGLAAAAVAERADGDRRATLLLALAGGCLLLATRLDTPGRYGAATLGLVAAAGALYRSTLAGVGDAG